MKYMSNAQHRIIGRALLRAHKIMQSLPDVEPATKESRRSESAHLEGFTDLDPWVELVRDWALYPEPRYGVQQPLSSTAAWPPRIYGPDIMRHALGFPDGEADQWAKMRVGKIMLGLGYVQRRSGTSRRNYYWTLLSPGDGRREPKTIER